VKALRVRLLATGVATSAVGVAIARVLPLLLNGSLKPILFNIGVVLAFLGLWLIALSLRKPGRSFPKA